MNPLVILFLLLSLFGAGSAGLARYEMKRADRLELQLDAANDQLATEKKNAEIAANVSKDYQARLGDLSRKLSIARMRRTKPQCVVPSTPGGYNGPSGGGEPMGAHGISVEFLEEYAAEAERYRLQLQACQSFIKSVSAPP